MRDMSDTDYMRDISDTCELHERYERYWLHERYERYLWTTWEIWVILTTSPSYPALRRDVFFTHIHIYTNPISQLCQHTAIVTTQQWSQHLTWESYGKSSGSLVWNSHEFTFVKTKLVSCVPTPQLWLHSNFHSTWDENHTVNHQRVLFGSCCIIWVMSHIHGS